MAPSPLLASGINGTGGDCQLWAISSASLTTLRRPWCQMFKGRGIRPQRYSDRVLCSAACLETPRASPISDQECPS